MTIGRKVLETYHREGWSGVSSKGMLYLLRYVARLTDTWITGLEQSNAAYSLLPEEKALLKRNEIFRNCHQGWRCFVIGNGPSLKSQDLALLAGELTFVMSAFYKHPIVKQWQPTYYCFADPLFFDGSEPMKRFFNDLLSAIHTTIYFLPLQGREVFLRDYLIPTEKIYFVLFRGNLGGSVLGLPDFTRNVPGVQSVSQMAIMAAMYMGCSPIYLLGLDHDWLAQRGMDRHFYNGTTINGHPVASGNLDAYSYKSDLMSVLNLWNGYENLNKVAHQHKIQIINATNGGFLDVFPRVKYETLFDVKNKSVTTN